MQYEQCLFEEATHARLAGGKIVKLERRANLSYATWKEFGVFISNKEFKDLGITPLREVEVKPIEFVVHPVLVSFSGADIQALILPKDYQHVDFLTRFKCVQILGDEE